MLTSQKTKTETFLREYTINIFEHNSDKTLDINKNGIYSKTVKKCAIVMICYTAFL